MAELKTEHGILALVDIVDFTGQANRLDDRFTAQYTKYFNDRMREIVSRHHYMVIKSLGDAILFFGTVPAGILDIMLDL
jgi:class 3 adenylate cyclase